MEKNLMATYKLTDKITLVYCTGKDSLSIVVDNTNNKEVSIHDEVISNNTMILHQCLIYNILEVCKQLNFKFNPEDHFREMLDISRSILDVDKRVFPEGHRDEYFDKMLDTLVSMSSDEVSANEDVEEKLANLISRIQAVRQESKGEDKSERGSVEQIKNTLDKLPESIKKQDTAAVLDAVKSMLDK